MDERRTVDALIERIVSETNLPNDRARAELRRELQSHFEESGSSPDAIRATLARFGSTDAVSEAFRHAYPARPTQRGVSWLEHASRDLRHAWRTIARMPGLAAVVVLSLAVGIGVNTAVFSWIQAVVLRPLPGVVDARSLQLVEPRTEHGTHPGSSWIEYLDLAARTRSFDGLIAFRMVPLNLGEATRTERTYGQLVSGNYFSVLGLRPSHGRLLRAEDAARPGGEPVVVVSHTFWRTRMGAVANPVGQVLRFNGRDVTIVGVAPERFQGTALGLTFDVWAPATLAPVLLAGSRELEERSQRGYAVMGRLRPSVTRAQAEAEVRGVMRELAAAFPQSNAKVTADVLAFGDALRGPQVFLVRALAILQGLMLVLLLAVCGNTATLVLARASARQREIGVRRALGAGRGRIVSLLLTENLVMAVAAAALGAVLAVWGTNALRSVPMPTGMPIRFQTGVDLVGLAFAMLLGITCGAIFGLAPALQLGRVDPQSALRSGASSEGRSRLRSTLVAAEVALALVVLVAAGLFWRRLGEARETDPGFRRDGVLLAAYDLTGRATDSASTRAFSTRLLDRLRALPGIEAASIASSVPLDIHGMPSRSFSLEGRARSDASEDQALYNVVTPGYFRTMGLALVDGKDFAELGDRTAAPQAIVNEAFVSRYLGTGQPLGRRLRVGQREYVIVGVVRTSLYESFGERPMPTMHFSYRDRPLAYGQIHIRARAGTEAMLSGDVRRVVRDVDPGLPIYDVRTLTEHVEKNLVFQRVPARMFVVLGPLLLVLVAIGIYAVVAYTIARRTTEIGVRLALGATGTRVVTQMVREVLRVVAAGAAAGLFIAFVVVIHVARGRPVDLPVLLGVPTLLLVVATFACWLPARRAAMVDPVAALRQSGE
jgi:predicted permease